MTAPAGARGGPFAADRAGGANAFSVARGHAKPLERGLVPVCWGHHRALLSKALDDAVESSAEVAFVGGMTPADEGAPGDGAGRVVSEVPIGGKRLHSASRLPRHPSVPATKRAQ